MENLYHVTKTLIQKVARKGRNIMLIIMACLFFPYLSYSQVTTTELFNFGVDNKSFQYWSWNSADFTIVDNPSGENPSAKVRKWQKGGNWTGFGTTLSEAISLKGARKISLWIYNDQQPISFIVAQLKDEAGKTIIDKNIKVNFPAQTWSLLEVEVEPMDTKFKDLLFMPDGNVAINVGTNYYVAQVLFENEYIEPIANNITADYSEKIIIDGDLSDWDGIAANEIEIPSNGAMIDSDEDFSANFKAVWDDNNIYLNINVTDEQLDNNPLVNPWDVDGIEIAFNLVNLDNYKLTDLLNDDDEGKISIVYGDNTDSTRYAKSRKMDMLVELSNDYKLFCTTTDIGYSIELVIPFTNIAPNFKAMNGAIFQMAILVNDRDNGSKEAKLTWGGKKNINKDNSDFAITTLQGKPELAKDIVIDYAENITIDGDLSDWDAFTANPINIATDGSVIDNSSDFSGNFKAAWNDEYIFLNVNVADDELDNNPADNPWNLDGMEIAFNLINLDNYKLTDLLNDDDEGKVAIVYGDNADSTRYAKARKMDMLAELSEKYNMVCTATEGGYSVELMIPFSNIAPEFSPMNGKKIQMAILLNDRDNGVRIAKLTWGGKNNINKDNSDFATTTLQGKPMIAEDISIDYANSLTIDGDFSDWEGYLATHIVIPSDGSVIDSDADFSCNFKTAWNKDYIFINVNVTDNELDNNPTENPWNVDGMEIAFNLINFNSYSLVDALNDEDEGKIAIVYGDNADSTRNAPFRRMDMLVDLQNDYEMMLVETEKGYSVEMKVPFNNIAPEFVAGNEVEIQMAILVNDRDNGTREAKLSWGGKKNINKDNSDFATATLFGDKTGITLVDNSSNDLLICPNPVTNNRMNMQVSGVNHEEMTLTLFNLSGQLVFKHNIHVFSKEMYEVELPETIVNGTYILKVQSANQSLVKRLSIR